MSDADLRTRAEQPLVDRLREQLDEWELWDTDPNAAFEQMAEQFYADTGLIALGKSVPLEMSSVDEDARRRQRYTEWTRARRTTRQIMLRQVLAALAAAEQREQALRDQLEEYTLSHPPSPQEP